MHKKRKKGGRFNVFGRGGILHSSKEGMRPLGLPKRVTKTNGKLGMVDSVRKVIQKFKHFKRKWDGERKVGSGVPSSSIVYSVRHLSILAVCVDSNFANSLV